jgi:hypothetical protein
MDSFEQVEQADMGSGTHERYLRLADELADRFGVPHATVPATPGHACCACGHHTRR